MPSSLKKYTKDAVAGKRLWVTPGVAARSNRMKSVMQSYRRPRSGLAGRPEISMLPA